MKLYFLLLFIPYLVNAKQAPIKPRPIRTYQQLIKFIKQNKINSIDELIPYLDSELLSNYMLPFASNSPQKSSFQKPRVILTNENSEFTIAYEGDPNSSTGEVLEIVERNPKTKELEFSKIDFKQPDIKRYSHKDKSCIACHGKKLKNGKIHMNFIWDSYPDWVRVYGSSHNGSFNLTDLGNSENKIPLYENNAFKMFQSTAKENKRYKHLIGISKIDIEDLAHFNSFQTANFRKINNQNIAQKIFQHSRFEELISNFYMMVVNNEAGYSKGEFEDYLPTDIKAQYINYSNKHISNLNKSVKKYLQKIKDARLKIDIKNNHPQKTFNVKKYSINELEEIIQHAFMLDQFGINITNISQTKPDHGLDFHGPGTKSGKYELWQTMLEEGLLALYPELNSAPAPFDDSDNYTYKVLKNPPNKKKQAIIDTRIRLMKSSKSTREYIAYLKIDDSSNFNYILGQTKDHFFSLRPKISDLELLANKTYISPSNKYELINQGLKQSKTINEFITALKIGSLHKTNMPISFRSPEMIDKISEASDLTFTLFSKYYDKFIHLNPTQREIMLLEEDILLKPHLAADLYDRNIKKIKNAKEFAQYFLNIDKNYFAANPRMKFVRSNLFMAHIDKYLPQIPHTMLKALLNTGLFLPDTIRYSMSLLFNNIKTDEDYLNFKLIEEHIISSYHTIQSKTLPTSVVLKRYHQSLQDHDAKRFANIFKATDEIENKQKPALKILLNTFFKNNYDKYIYDLDFDDLKTLINNTFLSNKSHDLVLKQIKIKSYSRKELESFHFRKHVSLEFIPPKATKLECLKSIANRLLW